MFSSSRYGPPPSSSVNRSFSKKANRSSSSFSKSSGVSKHRHESRHSRRPATSSSMADDSSSYVNQVALPLIFYPILLTFQLQHTHIFHRHARRRDRTTPLRRPRRRPLHITLFPECPPQQQLHGRNSQAHLPTRRRTRDLLIGAGIPLQGRLLPTSHAQQKAQLVGAGAGERRGSRKGRVDSLPPWCRWRCPQGHCHLLRRGEVRARGAEEGRPAKARSP